MSDANLISKTRRKKQMRDLQDLGAELTRLPGEQLARLELPEVLRQAVVECRRMTKHEAIRRQLQYIGRIMRELEAGPIAAQLESLRAPARSRTALFHRAEHWRHALMTDPAALALFVREHPRADPHRLRELAAAAAEERGTDRPPRRYRELFQLVNAILEDDARNHP